MTGDLLDIVLVGACLLFAVSGYRQGFLVGALSFVGFLGGGALGAVFGPPLVRQVVSSETAQALLGLVVVLVAATIGQVLLGRLGSTLRRLLTFSPARLVDSLAGAAVSVVSVLLLAWLLGTALVSSPFTALSTQVRRSAVLQTVDAALPASATTVFASFRRLLDQHGLPRLFAGIGEPAPATVAPPDPALRGSAVVRTVMPSILKVVGDAQCGRRVEGSSFVISPQHVLTNAHVVAGVRRPQVILNGRALTGRPVRYDAKRDVAVLYVPDLPALTPLSVTGTAKAGDGAIVIGYPENGPFTAVSARVRDRQRISGPDIYQSSIVTREVYTLRAQVLPGNSGGPLVSPQGTVDGVVFAASTDMADVGYALTAQEVAPDVRAGVVATTAVSTGACD